MSAIYIITCGMQLWSNEFGWVEKSPSFFTATERNTLSLPSGKNVKWLLITKSVAEKLMCS